jgi:hypothetical protein
MRAACAISAQDYLVEFLGFEELIAFGLVVGRLRNRAPTRTSRHSLRAPRHVSHAVRAGPLRCTRRMWRMRASFAKPRPKQPPGRRRPLAMS